MLPIRSKLFGNENVLCSWLLSGTSLIAIRKHGGHSNQTAQSTLLSDRADNQPQVKVKWFTQRHSIITIPSTPLFSFRNPSTRSSIYFSIDFHETHVILACSFLCNSAALCCTLTKASAKETGAALWDPDTRFWKPRIRDCPYWTWSHL